MAMLTGERVSWMWERNSNCCKSELAGYIDGWRVESSDGTGIIRDVDPRAEKAELWIR